MKTTTLKQALLNGTYDKRLNDLYVDEHVLAHQKARYVAAIEKYEDLYGEDEVAIYSAPGRSEVGGNHTDHQHGAVLATAINLDAIGVVGKQEKIIKILSDDFDIAAIDISDTALKENEKGTSEGLVRGVVARFKELGYQVGGFKAYITSEVLIGAGMSSSAAFEVLIGTILSYLYNDGKVDAVTIAKVGQYAENVYFGKPCGLMDQCASSVGGLVNIDFANPEQPIVNVLTVDFASFKHSLCIVDTKGSHANLTPDYAAIPEEMKSVAQFFGKEVLNDVSEDEFYQRLAEVRVACHDRAVLRAIHYFNENKRVAKEVAALNANDFETFKQVFTQSAKSSFEYLQNIYSPRYYEEQGMSLALALSEMILQEHGVCRVHGGGFAGTIQVFVADEFVETYRQEIEKYFGQGACHVLKVRAYGGCEVIA